MQWLLFHPCNAGEMGSLVHYYSIFKHIYHYCGKVYGKQNIFHNIHNNSQKIPVANRCDLLIVHNKNA